jgi:hypothetical protein
LNDKIDVGTQAKKKSARSFMPCRGRTQLTK